MPRVGVYGSGDLYGDPNIVYGPASVPEGAVMSQDNKISVAIAGADKDSFKAKSEELAGLTPWRTNVPAADKSSYTIIGTSRAGMDQVFNNQMDAHPELVPSYVNMTEVKKDLKFRQDVAELLAVVLPIIEGMQDAALLASSDSYNAYSAFKHSVDTAVARNVPGADTIKAALDPFFPAGRPKKTTPPA